MGAGPGLPLMFGIVVNRRGNGGWCLAGLHRTRRIWGRWVVFSSFCLRHW